MTVFLDPTGRRVHVPGRADGGRVIQWGKDRGAPNHNVYAVVIHFEQTGEVSYYNHQKVELVDDDPTRSTCVAHRQTVYEPVLGPGA